MDLPELSITIGLEKPFDSLNWNFSMTVLDKFKFGPFLIKWTEVFYTNVSNCIINNGFISKYFRVNKSVRQGDPLSPFHNVSGGNGV